VRDRQRQRQRESVCVCERERACVSVCHSFIHKCVFGSGSGGMCLSLRLGVCACVSPILSYLPL
jgi:hypothetical protein